MHPRHFPNDPVGGVPARRDLPTAIVDQPFRLGNVRSDGFLRTEVRMVRLGAHCSAYPFHPSARHGDHPVRCVHEAAW